MDKTFEATIESIGFFLNSDLAYRYLNDKHVNDLKRLFDMLFESIKTKMEKDIFNEDKKRDNLCIEMLDILIYLKITRNVDISFSNFCNDLTLLIDNYNSLVKNEKMTKKIETLDSINKMELTLIEGVTTMKILIEHFNRSTNSKKEIYDINKLYLDSLMLDKRR